MIGLLQRFIHRFLHRESGQSSVLFALAASVLVMVSAVVIDYGRPALEARRLQNAADSAALAASKCLPFRVGASRTEIDHIALDYTGKNGYPDSAQVDVALSRESGGKYYKVTVTVKNTVDYTLARIMGLESAEVERSASVEWVAATGINHAVPLSITKEAMDECISSGNYYVTLKYSGGGGTQGAYGAIDPDRERSGGANQYLGYLQIGYDGILNIGDTCPIEAGNMAGPTKEGVEYRYEHCNHTPACTPEHFDPECSRVILVPIVTYISAHTVRIEGFAPFFIDYVEGSKNNVDVHGTYIPGVEVEGVTTGATANIYGTYIRKITE